MASRSRQAIISNLKGPRTVGELAKNTRLHPITIYRVLGEMEREGEVYVTGFAKSPLLRGHNRKVYERR
jgi:DNA-binding transcriptional regulator YhcF (GntR family)